MNRVRSLCILQTCCTEVPTSKQIFSHGNVERFLAVKDHNKILFSKRKLYTFISNNNDMTKLSGKVVIHEQKKIDKPCTFAVAESLEVPIDEELLVSAISLMNTQSYSENISNNMISNPYSALPSYSNESLNSGLQHLKHPSSSMTFAGKRWYSTESSDSDKSKKSDSEPQVDSSQSKAAQLRNLFAVYGAFGIAFHITISLASLGIMYLIVSSGIDVIGLLSKMGIELSSVAGNASTMVIAYAVHKLILPVRASITLVSVPVVVRYLRKIGYLKK